MKKFNFESFVIFLLLGEWLDCLHEMRDISTSEGTPLSDMSTLRSTDGSSLSVVSGID